MPTVLLIEDDRMFRQLVRDVLEPEQFMIFEVSQGKRSLDILGQHPVDLVMLDLHLPDAYGLDLMKDIRAATDAPVVVITGDQDIETQIASFAAGADDFITKPFTANVMTARLHAHLRRYHNDFPTHRNQNTSPENLTKIRFGSWTMDRRRYQLFDDQNRPGDLTMREFQLLDKLIINADQVMRREDLCDAIREDRYVPTPRAIDVKITRIRKKIGDHAINPTVIKTVRGAGYMFNGSLLTAAVNHT